MQLSLMRERESQPARRAIKLKHGKNVVKYDKTIRELMVQGRRARVTVCANPA